MRYLPDLLATVVSQRLQGALEMAMVLASEHCGEHCYHHTALDGF